MADRSDPFADAVWGDSSMDISIDEPAPCLGAPPGGAREPGALRWIPEPRALRRPLDSAIPPRWRLVPGEVEGAAPEEGEPPGDPGQE